MNNATHVRAHASGERGRIVRFVYFVLNESGHVKIGVSWAPQLRLSTLQIGSSERLTLVGAIPGNEDAERAWHTRFASFRVGGEWFLYEGDLKDAVLAVCQEVGAYAEKIATLEAERFLLSEDIKDVYDEIIRLGFDRASLAALVEKKTTSVDPLPAAYLRAIQ